jgi:Acyclic terpene utilisation family protein AtuA
MNSSNGSRGLSVMEASRKTVRIAGGQGMYGDRVEAISTLIDDGADYLILEALAELTLAILAKDRARDNSLGYTRDLGRYMDLALPAVAARGMTVITNAGGINVASAAHTVAQRAEKLGLSGIKIATVEGDELGGWLPELQRCASLRHMENDAPWQPPTSAPLFANVYLGARPIVEALHRGADVVLTGRVADPALFLAPLIHEFGWDWDDYDRIASGIAIGHLSECSAQSTGGNFSGEWWTIPDPTNFAYPVFDCAEDGSGVLRKAAGTGGRINFDTVRHQLLYEVHDPGAYVTPDVIADFGALDVVEVGPDQVHISGAKGRAPTYKAIFAFENGWMGESRVGVSWPDAHAKAQAFAQMFRQRVIRAGLVTTDWHEEFWGVNALHGSTVPPDAAQDAPEVMLRVTWRAADQRTAALVAREMPPIALSGPVWGVTGGRGMLGQPSSQLRLWPTLIDKKLIDDRISVQIKEC